MKNTNHSSTIINTNSRKAAHAAKPMTKSDPWRAKSSLTAIRTTARDYANPVASKHPYPCMAKFADRLALGYDANRTRHSYYRQVRLIHQHFGCDPAAITEAQLRDYFLFVKLKKGWTPKTIRQARAAADHKRNEPLSFTPAPRACSTMGLSAGSARPALPTHSL